MYDVKLELKDAGLVAADAAGQVGGSDKIVNLGAGFVNGNLVIDVSEIEIASGDELYKISLQGSSKADFADTFEDLAICELGANAVLGGDQGSEAGRYVIPFRTSRKGTIYPYVRVYTDVNGTIATGINFTAYMEKWV